MSAYQSKYKSFVFEDYDFNPETGEATFQYSFDKERFFTEKVTFSNVNQDYNDEVLQRVLKLCFLITGVSYFKCFPTKDITFNDHQFDVSQTDFAQIVYTYGLSQFMYENQLELSDMPVFSAVGESEKAVGFQGSGVISLQSGGKDSLLLATLLEENKIDYTPWYISSASTHPKVLDQLKYNLSTAKRQIDLTALATAKKDGALNGHIPITFVVLGYALIEAVLKNQKTVLMSIGAEGAEPHTYIERLPVNHQWSKTWEAEVLFAEYVHTYISSDFQVGSPLRGFSELKIAELFVTHCWDRFGEQFSSCNRANYLQGEDNQVLKWCGECPKCANTFLLFAPFVDPNKLMKLFSGQNLFEKPLLQQAFKGLLGIEGVMKPFECVGEVDELRCAYHMAQERFGKEIYSLPFEVPNSDFDYNKTKPTQNWVTQFVPTQLTT